jgi:hypothetical protein
VTTNCNVQSLQNLALSLVIVLQDTVILPKTVTECTECKEKEAEVKRLKRVTQKLKIRIRQLESTLEAEVNYFCKYSQSN